jgi:hypothetical protein
MLRRYYSHFAGTTPKPKQRDWGTYIKKLREFIENSPTGKRPNPRTVDLLNSIRGVDRNPLIHPELDLDKDTALMAFDMCKNVIMFMVADIKATP